MKIEDYLKEKKQLVDQALDQYLPGEDQYPQSIHRAMRYSVLGDGKRIRPILALASCEACGGKLEEILPVACGIEMIHAYSLIHDDLPALDNDDFRRDRPSCHKQFGEATAILAGDALLTLGMRLFGKPSDSEVCRAVLEVMAHGAGTDGMIGGQVIDLEVKPADRDQPTLEYIHTRKTGALIAASVKAGAVVAGADDGSVEKLTRFGECIGLVFQIVDDILDNEDYAVLFGPAKARQEARHLTDKAKEQIAFLGERGEVLTEIADMLVSRLK
ncbi:MAG: polyprenyl synthetase family protein [Candidatus Omnitrophica bacterium]|nr:polyprenyl synthetase family protein [Candidatus Omnitrophota bacterium]